MTIQRLPEQTVVFGGIMEFKVYFLFLLSCCYFLVSFAVPSADEHFNFSLDDPHVCNDSYYTTLSERVSKKGPCKKKKGLCRTYETVTKRIPQIGCCAGFFFNGTACVLEMKTCSSGYSFINKTHCAPDCNPGFYNDPTDPNLVCKSKCNQPCINANCTDIDTCTCLPGYSKIDQYQCEPFCLKCDNGICIAPDLCQCDDGYKLEDGECSCDFGYQLNEETGSCSPVVSVFSVNCKECEGTCKEDVCACSNGTACEVMNEEAAGVESTPTLAAVQVTWISAVGVLFLLLVIIVAVIWHMYRKNSYDYKTNGVEMNEQGSVAYTVSNTLMPPADRELEDDYFDDVEPSKKNEVGLLPTTYSVRL